MVCPFATRPCRTGVSTIPIAEFWQFRLTLSQGASIIDWFAYGFAARTVKGANETFDTGDVRGVIAAESANNATTSAALVSTIAFGVPGSTSMAFLLGAFLIPGLQPGP